MSKELKIRITGDSSGLRSATDDSVGILEGFSSKVSALSVAAGSLLADGIKAGFKATGGFLKESIMGAADLNETVSKVGVVFGDAAPQIQAFAATAATTLGQSKAQAMEAAAGFAIFGKSAGLSGKELAGFSTDLVKIATDLASINNTSTQDAIDAISQGLRGEQEGLRKYGVLLDDATLRQKALELGIVSSTKNALTPQQKVLAAQKVITEQAGYALDDFKNTNKGLPGQMKILSAQFKNFKDTVGTAFIPFVLAATTAINTRLMPVIEKFGPLIADRAANAVKTLATAFREGHGPQEGFGGALTFVGVQARFVFERFRELLPAVGEFVKAFGGQLLDAIKTVVIAFREGHGPQEGFAGLLTWLGTSARIAWEAFRDFLPTLRDFADVVVGKLQAGLSFLNDNMSTIRDVVADLAPPLAAAVGAFIAFNKVQSGLSSVVSLVSTLGGFLLANPIALAVAGIAAAFVVAYKTSDTFREAVDKLAGRFVDFAKSVKAAFDRGGIGEAFRVALDGIKSALGDLWQWFLTTAVPAMGGWIDTATAYLAARLPGWLATLGDWIENTVLPWLSVKAYELAVALGNWIVDSAVVLRDNLPGWLKGLTEWFVGTVLPWVTISMFELSNAFSDWVLDAVAGLLRNLPRWTIEVQRWFSTDGIDTINSIAEDLANLMIDASNQMIDGFIIGLGRFAHKLYDAAKQQFKDNVLGGIKDALGINSPSREAAKLGLGVAEGMVLGMSRGLGMVSAAATDLSFAALPDAGSSFGAATASSFVPAGASAVGGTMTVNITTGADPQAVVTAIKTYVRQNGSTPW